MIQDVTQRTRKIRQRLTAVTVAMALAGGVALGLQAPGGAQNDGTGAATPRDCVIVNAVAEPLTNEAPATLTPAPPAATPDASPVTDGFATPVASPAASPVADVPADPNAPLIEELTATSNALFACLNESNFTVYAQLTSDAFRGQIFGSDEPLPADEFVVLAESLADADNRILDVTAYERIDDATASVEVTYVSASQQRTGVWTFAKDTVDDIEAWVLQREMVIPTAVPEGAATIDVTFEDSAFALDPDTATSSDVVLNLNNPTADDHEALVLRLDDGVTTDALLQSTSASLPDGITLIGQATVLAGDDGTLLLTGLEPGTYIIVDLFPDENGLPNLSSGMAATFTVAD